MARKKTEFVVSRLNWRPAGDGRWWLAPDTFRLTSFGTRDEALAERARREDNARGRVNPFRCGKPFAELTTIPEPIFLDWVSDTGLSPPKPAKKNAPRDWAAWWAATRPKMTPEQHAKLWEGLNKLHFFRVDEHPDVPMGYVLVSVIWDEGEYCQRLNAEGGEVRAVYRTRAGALEAGRAIDWSPGDPRAWDPVGSDLFDPETYWALAMSGGPKFDIVPVELPGIDRTTRKVHLVVRHIAEYVFDSERVPVGGAARKADAEAVRDEHEAEFRRTHDVWEWFEPTWEGDEDNRAWATAVRVGLPPAGMKKRDWWWRSLTAPPTPEQRAALWEAVPEHKAYEVIEVKLLD